MVSENVNLSPEHINIYWKDWARLAEKKTRSFQAKWEIGKVEIDKYKCKQTKLFCTCQKIPFSIKLRQQIIHVDISEKEAY